jgi:hypothetical protein
MFLILLGLAVLDITATVLTEVEHFFKATLVLIASVVLAQLLHVVNIIGFAREHAERTVYYILGYLAIGVVWSFIKWFAFLFRYREEFRTLKENYLRTRGAKMAEPILPGTIPEEWMSDFKEYVERERRYNYDPRFRGLSTLEKPNAADGPNRARTIYWMSLWPCSFLGTVLNDPVRRIFNFLFTSFKALYQKMVDAMFAKDRELK